MRGMYTVTMGDRGCLVVPAELRQHEGWKFGHTLVFLQTSRGVVLLSRQQFKEFVRTNLDGLDLVEELLADRRAHATTEDGA